ncbi:MAG: outer membrane protein transport protein [Bdellovibrionaceae bacterium]|nr:outer membrane protein transport protein [Pseudobdellovibrionaceae bacterium]NUM58954.1 hypothetical protein [Pseudobdellovibrionaceae bacterium]
MTTTAAYSNYNSILLGDQSAGMGGAATAVVGDTSAAAFYNPATLARLNGASFSAAVGIYKKFDTVYGEEEDFTKAPLRVNQGFFRSLPASTGNVIRLGEYVFGLSILVPDYDSYKGDLLKKGNNATTLAFIDESLWVGPSISKEISNTESIGITAYYTARNFIRSSTDLIYESERKAVLYNQEKTITENSLVFVFGYYKQLSSSWSTGITLRPKAMRIAGTATLFQSKTTIDLDTSLMSVENKNDPDKATRVVIPGKITLGLAYAPDNATTWAMDLSLHEGVSYVDLEDESIGKKVTHKAIWNLSLGLEKALIQWLRVRMGLFTNFSSFGNPDPNLAQLQEDKVDMIGFSANLVFIASKRIGYTFGGYYTGGRGKSSQYIQGNYEVITKTQHVFTMLVGSQLYF